MIREQCMPTLKAKPLATAALFLVLVCTGCAAPDSAMQRITVRGMLAGEAAGDEHWFFAVETPKAIREILVVGSHRFASTATIHIQAQASGVECLQEFNSEAELVGDDFHCWWRLPPDQGNETWTIKVSSREQAEFEFEVSWGAFGSLVPS